MIRAPHHPGPPAPPLVTRKKITMKLQGYVTVEGDTYPEGMDTKDVENAEHRKVLEAMDAGDTKVADPEPGDPNGDSEPAYSGKEWTVKKLQAELDARNDQLPETDQIQPEGDKKDDLVAALKRMDELHPVTQ